MRNSFTAARRLLKQQANSLTGCQGDSSIIDCNFFVLGSNLAFANYSRSNIWAVTPAVASPYQGVNLGPGLGLEIQS